MLVTQYHHMTDEELLRHAYLTRSHDELTMELATRLTKFMPRSSFHALAGAMPRELYEGLFPVPEAYKHL